MPLPATIDLGALDGITGTTLSGIDASDKSGVGISSAGDVNGDGYADFLIGAYFADPNGLDRAGETYLVYGGAGGLGTSFDLSALDGTNGTLLTGNEAGGFSGAEISAAGDVDGDGYDDFLIGAFYNSPGGVSLAGQSFLVFGSAAGLGATLDLGSLDGTNGTSFNGISSLDRSGLAVSTAGDVDGDGLDDFLIGAPYGDLSGAETGETYLIYGSAARYAASIDLVTLDGTTGSVLTGVAEGDGSGASATSAGDVNGDGFDDILIGARTADPDGKTSAGETYLVYGRSGGFGASFDLATLDGINGTVLTGIDADDRSGSSVSSAGDVNGDGYDDFVIGAYSASNDAANLPYSGEAYLVFGGADGLGASFDLASLDGTNGVVLHGMWYEDHTGASVSAAGDVNGDGYADIIIGAPRSDPAGMNWAGEAYVVYGSAEGFAASIDLTALDGTDGFILVGAAANDQSGYSLSGAGDVNGDGVDDMLVGAWYASPDGKTEAGESYVVYGQRGGTGGADTLDGTEGDDTFGFLAGSLGAGDAISGGAGYDTVDLSGGGTFDFTGVTLSGIELIASYGGDATLIMDDLADARLVGFLGGTNDTVDLRIGGAAVRGEVSDLLFRGAETVSVTHDDYTAIGVLSGDRAIVTNTDTAGRPWATITREFDLSGNLRSVTRTMESGSVSTVEFDALGTILSKNVAKAGGQTVDVTYNEDGQVTQRLITQPSGIESLAVYDPATGQQLSRLLTDNSEDGSAAPYSTSQIRYDGSGAKLLSTKVLDDGTIVIDGFAQNDSIDFGADREIVRGRGGDDVFVFDTLGGEDVIRDFDQNGDDRIDLSAFGVKTLADLVAADAISQQGAHVVVDYAALQGGCDRRPDPSEHRPRHHRRGRFHDPRLMQPDRLRGALRHPARYRQFQWLRGVQVKSSPMSGRGAGGHRPAPCARPA